MPLVNIDIYKSSRTPAQVRQLADTVHRVLVEHFNAPPRDRYQLIYEHDPEYGMICEDTGLGYTRTNQLVFIRIQQQGRNTETKQKFYKELAAALNKETGLRGEDLIVTCNANSKEDWSFGEGRAQFLDGGL